MGYNVVMLVGICPILFITEPLYQTVHLDVGYNVVMLLVTEGPGELACAVVVTILLMMTLLTIVLTLQPLYPLLSAGHGEQVSQLGPELRLSPLEDGAVTMTDHGQAHHHNLVLDTPQQHPDDISSLITTQQHLMLSAQVVV